VRKDPRVLNRPGYRSSSPLMSELGQPEKNSVRAYVFHFTLELGHYSTQSARLKRARSSRTLASFQRIGGADSGAPY
jgi:hypothetical protein